MLEPLGYVWRKSYRCFDKKQRDKTRIIGIGVAHYGEVHDVSLNVAIRFDAVEELINSAKGYITAREKARTATLGGELGNIANGVWGSRSVREQGDVDAALGELVPLLLEVGVSYMDRYEDPHAAFAALAGDGREAWLISPIAHARASAAVAMALVLGKETAEIDALVEKKRRYLGDDWERKEFEGFLGAMISSGRYSPGPRGSERS